MNGYDACRRISSKRCGQRMLLVAITGWGQEDDRELSREAGFDVNLAKPVNYTELLGLIASAPSSAPQTPPAVL